MFGFKKTGFKIAKFKHHDVYISDQNDVEEFISKDTKLTPQLKYPDGKSISAVLIAGPQGSGKSYLTANLIESYLKNNAENVCWYFSSTVLDDDPAYDSIDRMVQVITNSEDPNYKGKIFDLDFSSNNQNGGFFKFGDIFIFDDCSTIRNEEIRNQVFKYMETILETGRKLGFTSVITSHLINPNDKKFGRILLNEMTDLVIFPKSGAVKQIRYTLDNYFGFTKKEIEKILNTSSRWVWLHKCAPQYILEEHSIRRT